MDEQLKLALTRFKEVRELLVKFESKDKAVDYLIKETGISKEECSNAYDIIMKIDLDKQ